MGKIPRLRTRRPLARALRWSRSTSPHVAGSKEDKAMKRIAVFVYGVVAYATFLASFLYAIGFVGGFGVPRTLDGPRTGGLGAALAIDVLLLGLFAVQHSVMARPAFKRWWTTIVPPEAERSTYVLASSAALGLLFWLWEPIGGAVWTVAHPLGRLALHGAFVAGWLTVLVTTFLINHFDLFGLRQVWLQLRGEPYRPLRFVTPGPYRHVRHPLYVGWLLAFWATPTMTAAHLLFAMATTAYILIAIQLEERDLSVVHGPDYDAYRRRVPMLLPRLRTT
jgi:protein-S-isoprenylcysteine O-methyltransferase Ste14